PLGVVRPAHPSVAGDEHGGHREAEAHLFEGGGLSQKDRTDFQEIEEEGGDHGDDRRRNDDVPGEQGHRTFLVDGLPGGHSRALPSCSRSASLRTAHTGTPSGSPAAGSSCSPSPSPGRTHTTPTSMPERRSPSRAAPRAGPASGVTISSTSERGRRGISRVS